jgi:hypothetical protein
LPIRGDLRTMPLVELLQWVGANAKTGVLDLERNKIHRTIAFREGRIVGCASTDPSALLGHILISRGKIKKRSLQYALRHSKEQGVRLSDVLVEMGLVTDEECTEAFSDSAAETVYGLFEWQHAVFTFDIDGDLSQFIGADLSVDHILMSGAQRQDELDRIRGVFKTSGVVLGRTDRSLPANPENAGLVYPVLELVNGQRTIAEIVLQAHSSEFQVLKMLFTLHSNGNVEILEEREIKDGKTLLDVSAADEPVELPSLAELDGDLPTPRDTAGDETDAMLDELGEVDCDRPVQAVELESEDASAEPAADSKFTEPAELDILMEFASEKLERGDHEGALTMLDTCYKADLDPAERSILDLVDGKNDVQAITWMAPQREVEVMRALQGLSEKHVIRLEAPVAS